MSERTSNPDRLATSEAAANEARVNDFASTTSGWFWEMDADLRFVYFSASVEAITGVKREWHYGKTREDLGMPQSLDTKTWQAHLDTLKRQEPFSDFIFQRAGPDGVKWMQTSGVPIIDEAGAFKGYRGTASDVTVQVLAQQRGQALTEAIEHISESFVLWDDQDQLVICNARFRQINIDIPEQAKPGTLFADCIRAALQAGHFSAGGWTRASMV